ncbi:hypothetical protein [Paenibacillus sp. EZ-K15]|uniref:hypothetical protein n=1 Tax=Paenibacillus sp. EZ-K15 TaxID=2044275 RepID=UPI001F2C1D8B|nr:hypothetical protein [Paenibacillus sp. EZ-K15]
MLDEVGLINEHFYLGEDTTYLLRFFDKYRIALQTKPHSVYRESPDSLYFFCDRWQLDPDTIHLNEEIYNKIEGLSFKSIKVREHIRDLVAQSDSISKKVKQLYYIDIGIYTQLFEPSRPQKSAPLIAANPFALKLQFLIFFVCQAAVFKQERKCFFA